MPDWDSLEPTGVGFAVNSTESEGSYVDLMCLGDGATDFPRAWTHRYLPVQVGPEPMRMRPPSGLRPGRYAIRCVSAGEMAQLMENWGFRRFPTLGALQNAVRVDPEGWDATGDAGLEGSIFHALGNSELTAREISIRLWGEDGHRGLVCRVLESSSRAVFQVRNGVRYYRDIRSLAKMVDFGAVGRGCWEGFPAQRAEPQGEPTAPKKTRWERILEGVV